MLKRFPPAYLLLGLPVFGFLCAAAFLVVVPKTYESVAVVEIPSRSADISTLPGEVLAKPMLDSVIDRLGLAERWSLSHGEARKMLQTSVSIHQLPGTSLIEIRARDADPGTARDLTDAFAANTIAQHDARSAPPENDPLGALKEAQAARERDVEKAREEFADALPKGGALISPGEFARQKMAEAKEKLETAKTELEAIQLQIAEAEAQPKPTRKPATLHTSASRPTFPVSPNAGLILAIGFGIGLVAAILALIARSRRPE